MKTEINILQEKYKLEVESPFILIIKGMEISFDCLIKGYGAKNGMVVDSEWKKIEPVSNDLVALGYGFSCFQINDSSIDGFEEVLNDWGRVSA